MNSSLRGGSVQWIVSILGQNAVIDYDIVALSDIDKLNVVQPGQLFRWWILGWEGKPIDTERLIMEPFVGISELRYFTWGMRVNTGI